LREHFDGCWGITSAAFFYMRTLHVSSRNPLLSRLLFALQAKQVSYKIDIPPPDSEEDILVVGTNFTIQIHPYDTEGPYSVWRGSDRRGWRVSNPMRKVTDVIALVS